MIVLPGLEAARCRATKAASNISRLFGVGAVGGGQRPPRGQGPQLGDSVGLRVAVRRLYDRAASEGVAGW
jgi:hypothetical protein